MDFNAAVLEAIGTGFQALFLEGGEGVEPAWKDFCLEVPSTGDRETFDIPDGLGEMEEWIGPRAIRVVPNWSLTIVNKDWEHTIGVPINRIKDDRLGLFPQLVKMQGMNAVLHPDRLLFEMLTGAFANLGYDGVAFVAATHPTDTGTQTNLVSGALSATTFRTAVAQMDAMTDYFGKPLRTRAMKMDRVLMVGPSLRATAKGICDLPTLSSGAANPDYQEARTVVNEYLTGDYANYWFLLAAKGPIYPFILQMRERPEHMSVTDINDPEIRNNKRALFGTQGRWNMGPGFYQLIQGSTGA